LRNISLTKKSFIISTLTVFVQYYDYHLFGFLAANIASHFFPADEITTQLINAYLIMTIAMVAKPLGAIIFGKIGDLKGRSNSFKASLIGTAIASVILFATPTYESVGVVSCFLLLVCRMAICAFVTSGSDGVRIYIYEHIPESKQCLGIGVTTLFTLAGSLAASLSAWFFTSNNMPNYAWRFAFLLGGVMGILIVIVMKITNFKDETKIKDDFDFDKFKNSSTISIIYANWKLFLLCTVLAGGIGSTNQFIIIFFGTYNFEILGTIDRSAMQSYITLAILGYMVFGIVSGYFADRFNRYYVTLIGSFSVIIFSIILIVQLEQMQLNKLTYVSLVASLPFITMPAAAILKQSIPKPIRYRIFALSHALGSVMISAPTALLSTFIYTETNISWLPICYFISIILVISFVLYRLNKRIINEN
jgi:MFS transporter, MHS family, proline/betaine transporter